MNKHRSEKLRAHRALCSTKTRSSLTIVVQGSTYGKHSLHANVDGLPVPLPGSLASVGVAGSRILPFCP